MGTLSSQSGERWLAILHLRYLDHLAAMLSTCAVEANWKNSGPSTPPPPPARLPLHIVSGLARPVHGEMRKEDKAEWIHCE
jgi:hypothetical protein